MAGGSGAGSVIVRPTASPRLIKLVQVGDWGGGGSGGGRLCADGFMLCCRGREHLFLLRVLLVYCPSYYMLRWYRLYIEQNWLFCQCRGSIFFCFLQYDSGTAIGIFASTAG